MAARLWQRPDILARRREILTFDKTGGFVAGMA
jgi:hypothetical protein